LFCWPFPVTSLPHETATENRETGPTETAAQTGQRICKESFVGCKGKKVREREK